MPGLDFRDRAAGVPEPVWSRLVWLADVLKGLGHQPQPSYPSDGGIAGISIPV